MTTNAYFLIGNGQQKSISINSVPDGWSGGCCYPAVKACGDDGLNQEVMARNQYFQQIISLIIINALFEQNVFFLCLISNRPYF